MFMNHKDFMSAMITDHIREVETLYPKIEDTVFKNGSIKGLEHCRDKNEAQLSELLLEAQAITAALKVDGDNRLTYFTAYERAIEWVVDVISVRRYIKDVGSKAQPKVPGRLSDRLSKKRLLE